jgi:sporulation-control protein
LILRKYMSLLGIGSANIDLVLQKHTFKPGDPVLGCFHIKGGTIEQQLKRIDCDLVMKDIAVGKVEVIDTQTIFTSRRIKSDEDNEISFTFQLPDSVPVSTDEISYRFKTRLHFSEGMNSQDLDAIQIVQ